MADQREGRVPVFGITMRTETFSTISLNHIDFTEEEIAEMEALVLERLLKESRRIEAAALGLEVWPEYTERDL